MDDPSPRGKAGFRQVAQFTALGLLLLFLVLFLVHIAGLPPARLGTPTTPEAVAAEIEGKPATREWAIALRTHFPDDYRALLRRLAAAGRERGREGLAREGAYFLQDFLARKADAMASAPDAQLNDVADAWLATLRLLHSRNDPACGMIFTNNNNLDFSRLQRTEVTPPTSRETAMMILAAHAGETGQGGRRGPLAQTDLDAWLERAEAIDPQVTALLEEGALERATPRQRCGMLLAAFQAATELPPPVTANVIASVFLEAREEERPAARR